MQVTVETGTGLERRMRVQVPEDQVSSEVHKRLENLSRQVRMPGFRPGKSGRGAKGEIRTLTGYPTGT